MTTISVDRYHDTIRVRMTCSATEREVNTDLTDEEANALILHLRTHTRKPHFILAPPGDTTVTDVWRAMVGMFNQLADRRITRADVDALPAHLRRQFEEVP